MLTPDRSQILAFRLERHHLTRRLPAGSLVDAMAACGIQETPMLTAVLALHARIDEVTVAEFDRALKHDKTWLEIWAMRGAPYVVPTDEAAVFTSGALPFGEDSWRTFFGGWARPLSERDVSFSVLVQRAAAAELRRRLWRPVGSPGLVLIDGEAKAIWSSRRKGRTLSVIVEPFGPLRESERDAISDEADSIAPLRGAERATLTITE